MKKNMKLFIGILIGIIVSTIVGVSASILYQASEIGFTPRNSNWKVNNLESALNDLYDKKGDSSNVSQDVNELLKTANYTININDILKNNILYSNEEAMDKIVTNSAYTNLILNDSDAIAALDESNPIISNDANKVFYSTQYDGSWAASVPFVAINIGNTGWTPGAGVSYKDQYIGYNFGKKVWVYKMVIQFRTGKENTDYVLEASNDNENYTIIKDGLHENNNTLTIIPNNYSQKYQYYRIRTLSEISQSGSGNSCVYYIKLYAK